MLRRRGRNLFGMGIRHELAAENVIDALDQNLLMVQGGTTNTMEIGAQDKEKKPVRMGFMDGTRSMTLSEFTPALPESFVVAYVDLLGFKEMILKDPTGKNFIPLLEESVNAGLFFANFGKNRAKAMDYRVFSDNICFWCSLEYGPLAFSVMLATLSEFQLRLSHFGVFCRGGVAMGTHYASENVLYGPALVEAVELEKIADYPRILISSAIMGYPDLAMVAAFYYQVHSLNDGLWFVNYLWGVYFKTKEEGIHDLQLHSKAVVDAIERHGDNPLVLRKYEWCRAYHDDAVGHLTFATDGLRIGDIIAVRAQDRTQEPK